MLACSLVMSAIAPVTVVPETLPVSLPFLVLHGLHRSDEGEAGRELAVLVDLYRALGVDRETGAAALSAGAVVVRGGGEVPDRPARDLERHRAVLRCRPFVAGGFHGHCMAGPLRERTTGHGDGGSDEQDCDRRPAIHGCLLVDRSRAAIICGPKSHHEPA